MVWNGFGIGVWICIWSMCLLSFGHKLMVFTLFDMERNVR
jgi:hypothetical protein